MTYISEFTNATSHMHDYFAVKSRSRFHAASVLRAARVLTDAQYSGQSAAFPRPARPKQVWGVGALAPALLFAAWRRQPAN